MRYLVLVCTAVIVALSAGTRVLAASPPPNSALAGLYVGEPIADLRATLGDPVSFVSSPNADIRRYLALNGGAYLDVMGRNNRVWSITMVRRVAAVPFRDPRGATFGMTTAQVEALFGKPSRTSTNGDDGSVDLWYTSSSFAWIYELYRDNLGFIQVIAPPAYIAALPAAATPIAGDGTSVERAIWVRPANVFIDLEWFALYFANQPCGANGHWVQQSQDSLPDAGGKDPLAYTVVHAKCSTSDDTRTVYFDTHGLGDISKYQKNATVYLDPGLMPSATPSPGATATPSE